MTILDALQPTAWVALASALLLFIYKKTSSSSSTLPLPPGPRGWEALKSIIRGVRSGEFHKEISGWGKLGSPMTCCSMGNLNFVSINCPELVREVLTGRDTEAVVNDRPPTFLGTFLFYGPKDLAMASVTPSWGVQRKMFHSSLRLYGDGVHRFESTVQGELTRLIEQLEETDGRDICLEDYMSNTLLSVLSILMTGERPSKDSEVSFNMRRFDRVVSAMGTPSVDVVLRLFPFIRHLPGWFQKHCSQAIYYRDKLLDNLFNRSKSTVSAEQPRGIVDVMLLAQNSGSLSLSDDHIKGLILDVVLGGYVTSLTSFLSTVLTLLNLPRVSRAIQEEIDRAVGQRTPTLDDRKNLHFTEATLLEVLRFMRIFPLGLPHVVSQDIHVRGYRIPKHAVIFANQWECGRDPNTWDKADQFLPERFLDQNGHLLPADHPTRKNLLPFGIGKRTCPGETFARTRLFLLVTTLLQRFDFLPPTDGTVVPLDDIPWSTGAVLLPPSYECRVRRRAV
ncbi:steroid 17-alpha-hydroxylase/17,20 lyase-like [Littorina saxatilis]|uniref:Cytochrome P450 n=1 Tax=Littorina saxatilis TaxID=31220 RepID=A0AAN9G8Y3_9CAEN